LLALKRLLETLAQEGQISPTDTPKSQAELLVHNFGNYLREERALARRTINNRKTVVMSFLAGRFGKRSFQSSRIKAADLIAFVLKEAVRRRNSIKTVETALRSFLRYLLFTGLITQDLSIAVPSALNRRYTNIPRHLTADQVRRVLASCNRQARTGRRDYAILLLLARLGLRGGEVEALRVDDIDWTAGTLTVHGKGGRVRQMPLLHDVGKAIGVYLRKDWRPSSDRKIFQRIGAPRQGLNRTVGSIVRFALDRAGVESTSKGSHQFRHTIGNQMLAKGASLAEIGEVLRHENPDTTLYMQKSIWVPFARLRGVGQEVHGEKPPTNPGRLSLLASQPWIQNEAQRLAGGLCFLCRKEKQSAYHDTFGYRLGPRRKRGPVEVALFSGARIG
jgi:site-specific recombinase XerD